MAPRIAMFSPFPPVRTGVAACSAELVPALTARGYHVDPYPESAAHDFPWRHRLQPYDCTIYQFGNSSHHDYAWAYALRYPGVVVLHDTRLHHARAALLLREHRAGDYRAEFRANHPDASPDAAELAVHGYDSALFYEWGMVRSLIQVSRLVAVHGEGTRRELVETLSTPKSQGANPQVDLSEKIVSIRLGHGRIVTPEEETRARREVRARHGIAEDAVLFGVFGGLTPEKRIPQILAAFRAVLAHAPGARLILAGAPAPHYDVRAAIEDHGLADRVVVTGYVESDEDLTDHLAACDVSLNLRWPTARETSGPWLRALAAGKATVIMDLVHLADLASLDPRTWMAREGGGGRTEDRKSTSRPPTSDLRPPMCVAIDVLDEDHSLRLAMKRLATDADLRAALGRAARDYWQHNHTLEAMTDDYERLLHLAHLAHLAHPSHPSHPAHLAHLTSLLQPFGIEPPF